MPMIWHGTGTALFQMAWNVCRTVQKKSFTLQQKLPLFQRLSNYILHIRNYVWMNNHELSCTDMNKIFKKYIINNHKHDLRMRNHSPRMVSVLGSVKSLARSCTSHQDHQETAWIVMSDRRWQGLRLKEKPTSNSSHCAWAGQEMPFASTLAAPDQNQQNLEPRTGREKKDLKRTKLFRSGHRHQMRLMQSKNRYCNESYVQACLISTSTSRTSKEER